ncbi:MAG: D-alanyl-D-alanine carboxypeptidase, partial [Micromonosporaceae bacterium]
ADLGLRVDGSRLADGSGLSRRNRLSAALLTDLLTTALERPELAGVVSGLPVAGWSGTLADRYRSPQPRTAAGAGVVRAKTGTLSGVSALAGVLVTADGRLLVFALLANGGPDGTADLLDEVAATLAGCGCSG